MIEKEKDQKENDQFRKLIHTQFRISLRTFEGLLGHGGIY